MTRRPATPAIGPTVPGPTTSDHRGAEKGGSSSMRPIVIIPARMAATRLPGKPLADIGGVPMVVHVLRRAEAADVGDVAVACCDPEVAAAVTAAGGRAVMTASDHASGSDRVWEAWRVLDPAGDCDVAINLQGDLPDIPPAAIRQVLVPLRVKAVDVGTLVAPLGPGEREDPAVVKAHLATSKPGATAIISTFSRTVSGPDARLRHHVGIYAWRRPALAAFVTLPPSEREQALRLEQLRALDHGMRIDGASVDAAPAGVDTPADLESVRRRLGA